MNNDTPPDWMTDEHMRDLVASPLTSEIERQYAREILRLRAETELEAQRDHLSARAENAEAERAAAQGECNHFSRLWESAEKELKQVRDEVERLKKDKATAYTDRNRLVQALTWCFPSHLARHPEDDNDWDHNWRNIVFVELPTGQASWHIHHNELQWFKHLKFRDNNWDGHTTEQKHARIDEMFSWWGIQRADHKDSNDELRARIKHLEEEVASKDRALDAVRDGSVSHTVLRVIRDKLTSAGYKVDGTAVSVLDSVEAVLAQLSDYKLKVSDFERCKADLEALKHKVREYTWHKAELENLRNIANCPSPNLVAIRRMLDAAGYAGVDMLDCIEGLLTRRKSESNHIRRRLASDLMKLARDIEADLPSRPKDEQ